MKSSTDFGRGSRWLTNLNTAAAGTVGEACSRKRSLASFTVFSIRLFPTSGAPTTALLLLLELLLLLLLLLVLWLLLSGQKRSCRRLHATAATTSNTSCISNISFRCFTSISTSSSSTVSTASTGSSKRVEGGAGVPQDFGPTFSAGEGISLCIGFHAPSLSRQLLLSESLSCGHISLDITQLHLTIHHHLLFCRSIENFFLLVVSLLQSIDGLLNNFQCLVVRAVTRSSQLLLQAFHGCCELSGLGFIQTCRLRHHFLDFLVCVHMFAHQVGFECHSLGFDLLLRQ
mmetsp:Transcript_1438/g.2397  ORF Transcript_1438/g.2397 Transcript_1438/m.2397 type:complete len:287 (-) Transcript_1438:2728-3588(-)